MLGFRDSKKVGGISNELFMLVITSIIGQFDVSQILIDGGSLYDILYSLVFEK